jgi:hypothetical protein
MLWTFLIVIGSILALVGMITYLVDVVNGDLEAQDRVEYILLFLFPFGILAVKFRRRWMELDPLH